MNNLPQINSTIGPINVGFALNLSPEKMSKLTQGERIQLIRMIHSGYLKPSEDFNEEDE